MALAAQFETCEWPSECSIPRSLSLQRICFTAVSESLRHKCRWAVIIAMRLDRWTWMQYAAACEHQLRMHDRIPAHMCIRIRAIQSKKTGAFGNKAKAIGTIRSRKNILGLKQPVKCQFEFITAL